MTPFYWQQKLPDNREYVKNTRMAFKTILCTKKYLTRHSLKIPIVNTVNRYIGKSIIVRKPITRCLTKHFQPELIDNSHVTVMGSPQFRPKILTVMGSLIVLVNKRAEWNVPVSYIKYMSPCSTCGFSTKKTSNSINRTEPVSVRQFVKVYTGKDTKCGTSRKLIQYFRTKLGWPYDSHMTIVNELRLKMFPQKHTISYRSLWNKLEKKVLEISN
jgi:hypothetical protein